MTRPSQIWNKSEPNRKGWWRPADIVNTSETHRKWAGHKSENKFGGHRPETNWKYLGSKSEANRKHYLCFCIYEQANISFVLDMYSDLFQMLLCGFPIWFRFVSELVPIPKVQLVRVFHLVKICSRIGSDLLFVGTACAFMCSSRYAAYQNSVFWEMQVYLPRCFSVVSDLLANCGPILCVFRSVSDLVPICFRFS